MHASVGCLASFVTEISGVACIVPVHEASYSSKMATCSRSKWEAGFTLYQIRDTFKMAFRNNCQTKR